MSGHPLSGRYDLLFGFPGEAVAGEDFFERLNAAYARERIAAADDEALPFLGGWFLLLGYELASQVEPSLRLPRSPFALPDAMAVRCTAAAIHDRQLHKTWLFAETEPGQLATLQGDLAALDTVQAGTAELEVEAVIEEPAARYLDGAQRILEYLRAGDIFQANLSRRWEAVLRRGDYCAVYERLRLSNPAPFAGLARWNGTAVLSSSPERLVQIDAGWVQTRPIAGTRPRGVDARADAALRGALVENFKERAEHVMLIDLERNDLGRICRTGSVDVSELMTVESYAHVHHIVSNVRGRLRDDAQPGDVLRAVFPGGTITGCPKVRAMEIIAELEGEGRGPYTGSMGYLSRCGRLDSNILIRSIVVEGRVLSLRAGAGIVADSDPQAELEETRAKARGLLLALQNP